LVEGHRARSGDEEVGSTSQVVKLGEAEVAKVAEDEGTTSKRLHHLAGQHLLVLVYHLNVVDQEPLLVAHVKEVSELTGKESGITCG